MKQFNLSTISLKLMFFIFLIVISISSFSSTKTSISKKWKQAENLILNEKYCDAGKIYMEIFENEPENFNCAYKIGYCLLSSETEQDVQTAQSYLELASGNITAKYKNSYSEKKAPVISWYYLGLAYRLNNEE